MTDLSAARAGAESVIQDCLNLQPGSNLLLLVDETSSEIVTPFFQAAKNLDVGLVTLFYSRSQQLEVADLGLIARTAIDTADAAILAHTPDDDYSRFRTKMVSQWRGRTRLGTMPGASLEVLAIASRVDYPALLKRCERLTLPLLNGHSCRIITRSSRGTEHTLEFKLGGRERAPVHSTGQLLEDTGWGNIPSGEIFTAPLETSANGEYLVRGTVGRYLTGRDEALLTFRDGRVVDHCLVQAGCPVPHLTDLAALSASRGDKNWNVIAEFGIGVNDGITDVIGIPLVDEKILGTIHVGLGNNVGWQGSNSAQLHIDVVAKEPTVYVDNRPVIYNGVHTVEPADFDDLTTYRPFDRYRWPSSADVAAINNDAYAIESTGNLLVRLHTDSGRVTRFTFANLQTAAVARQFLRSLKPQDKRQSLSDLRPEGLEPESFHNLLSMLFSYGIIRPPQ